MIWLKQLVVVSLLCLMGVATWLWLTMLSPWFYERPEELPDIEQRTHQVFVYGTLRYLPIRWVVMGTSGSPKPARLDGFERQGLDLSRNADSERVEQTLADGSTAWVYVRLPMVSELDIHPPAHRIALVTYD